MEKEICKKPEKKQKQKQKNQKNKNLVNVLQ